MKASDLNFDDIHRLSRNEYPEGVLERMDADVIQLQSDLRKLSPDFYMTPSPLKSAHVRDRTKSAHSTNWGEGPDTRLSTATDFYMPWDQVARFWELAQSHPNLGGFGVYFDTFYAGQSMPLFHIDTKSDRGERLLWLRYCKNNIFYVPGKTKDPSYVYMRNDWERFHLIMSKASKIWE